MTKQCARIPTNTSDFLSQRSRRECHSVRRLHAPVVKTIRTPLPCHNQRENCHFTRKEFHWKQTVSEVWGKRPLRCVLTTDTNNYIIKSVRISWRDICKQLFVVIVRSQTLSNKGLSSSSQSCACKSFLRLGYAKQAFDQCSIWDVAVSWVEVSFTNLPFKNKLRYKNVDVPLTGCRLKWKVYKNIMKTIYIILNYKLITYLNWYTIM